MKSHLAEYISPGHPDRLADAIAESIVDLAVGRDPEALVGVECAVHTDHVFVDGRIAAGRGQCAVAHEELEDIAREVYRRAGYGERWRPAPEELRVIQNVCLEPLSDEERSVRGLSDDQNVVSGFACDSPATDYLPPAHFVAWRIGRAVDAWRRTLPEKFGPDFKVMADIEETPGGMAWRRLTLSIQHAKGVFSAEQHALVVPVVRQALEALEARGLKGAAALPLDRLVLNGAGDFVQGGPEGDNGLSGKKLAVDFYGPEVPIGGGAICGKDPHKVDVAGAFRARELALRILKERGGRTATVRLGWTPGDAAPAYREAETTDSLGVAHPVPSSALPPEDWFSIDAIVADRHLDRMNRAKSVLEGYFVGMAPPQSAPFNRIQKIRP